MSNNRKNEQLLISTGLANGFFHTYKTISRLRNTEISSELMKYVTDVISTGSTGKETLSCDSLSLFQQGSLFIEDSANTWLSVREFRVNRSTSSFRRTFPRDKLVKLILVPLILFFSLSKSFQIWTFQFVLVLIQKENYNSILSVLQLLSNIILTSSKLYFLFSSFVFSFSFHARKTINLSRGKSETESSTLSFFFSVSDFPQERFNYFLLVITFFLMFFS